MIGISEKDLGKPTRKTLPRRRFGLRYIHIGIVQSFLMKRKQPTARRKRRIPFSYNCAEKAFWKMHGR